MDHFEYRPGGDRARLYADGLAVDAIADAVGTPIYIYAASTMVEHARRFRAAFAPIDPMCCYAVKACSNHSVLARLFAPESAGGGGLGADVVSGLELERAWLAGCPMERVVFAGVGKSDAEIRAALSGAHSPMRDWAIAHGRGDPSGRGRVAVLNAESRSELERIGELARELDVPASVAIRVNPDIDAGAHDHTTTARASDKFGVTSDEAERLCVEYRGHPYASVVGFHVHLGSPIYSSEPYVRAIGSMSSLIDRVRSRGCVITHLDLGGGFGADYESGQTPSYSSFAGDMIPLLEPMIAQGVRIALEPGRTIVGNAGVLVVSVRHVKRQNGRRFVICDAGMNAMIRPSLYGAKHFVWPTTVGNSEIPLERRFGDPGDEPCDLVGPVCESGDFLARGVSLPEVEAGDRIAVFTSGAYGMTMASTYNDQPLPAEVLVDGDIATLVRAHQSPERVIDADFEPVAIMPHPSHDQAQAGASA